MMRMKVDLNLGFVQLDTKLTRAVLRSAGGEIAQVARRAAGQSQRLTCGLDPDQVLAKRHARLDHRQGLLQPVP
jgi:hypothetical protein